MSVIADHTLERRHTPRELLEVAPAWNELAERAGSPFLMAEWLAAWWRAFGRGEFVCFSLRDGAGRLRAGACCARDTAGGLAGIADDHSGDWDAVALDGDARVALWQEMARIGSDAVILPSIRDHRSVEAAAHAFRGSGYSIAATPTVNSPFLSLPHSWDELLGNVSRNLRAQFGRKRRQIEREGRLVFRTTRDGRGLGSDLHAFFSVEASGWKSRSATAILSDPCTTRLYTELARGLARAGWLRLHLLELDGNLIAGDLACVIGGRASLIKTGFDERFADLSPGLVLRGEVLRASIEEGASSYDFLGGPDPYKLRWGAEPRPRVTVRAFRGWQRPKALYHSRVRPPLRAGARRARELRSRWSGSR